MPPTRTKTATARTPKPTSSTSTPEPKARRLSSPHKAEAPRRLSYTIEEAAVALAVSRMTIYDLMGRGELETFHIGRARRITADSLEAFVARSIDRTQADGEATPVKPETDAEPAGRRRSRKSA